MPTGAFTRDHLFNNFKSYQFRTFNRALIHHVSCWIENIFCLLQFTYLGNVIAQEPKERKNIKIQFVNLIQFLIIHDSKPKFIYKKFCLLQISISCQTLNLSEILVWVNFTLKFPFTYKLFVLSWIISQMDDEDLIRFMGFVVAIRYS